MTHALSSIRPLRRSPALWAAALALAVATPAAAQRPTQVRDRAAQDPKPAASGFGVIDGVVTDSLLTPMALADITVVGTGARVQSAENGRFRFLQVPPGQYLLVVRRIGYSPTSGIVEVPANDTLRLAYQLSRSYALMDTVRVSTRRVSLRMLEFEQRRALAQGQFITQEQIDQRNSLQTSDYLRLMRGIEVSRNTAQAFGGTVALSRREGGALQGGCPLQVLLDGIVMPANFNLDLLPPPRQVAGIEVYSGAASVPPTFGGADRRCGVVAVWTRDGY